MKNKSVLIIGFLVCLCLIPGINLYSQAEEVKSGPTKHKLGIIFNIGSPLITIGEYSDNVQAGVGLKLWLNDKMALRGLLDFNYLNDSDLDVSDTIVGLGADFEYHFIKAKVSPYTGFLAGTRISTGAANNLTLYFGCILGAEVELLKFVSFFAESILS